MTQHDKNALTFLAFFVIAAGIFWILLSQQRVNQYENISPVHPHPTSSASGSVMIGEFNIQVFGKSKISKPGVMDILCPLARKFDILFVEEIRDSSDETARTYQDCINKLGGPTYAFVESERLGRTVSKEAYAYFYNSKTVSLLPGTSKVFADTKDWFEREPYLATFKSGNFDFTLVGIHVKPDDATAEIDHLHDVVVSTLASNPDEKDVIVLGDFNGDGTYFNENSTVSRLRGDEYLWAIGNEMDTMVTSNNTYDRIVLRKKDTTEYIQGSAGVLYFDKEYNLSSTSTKAISDHYPVYARFSTNGKDDD